jgi:hypothetical protein
MSLLPTRSKERTCPLSLEMFTFLFIIYLQFSFKSDMTKQVPQFELSVFPPDSSPDNIDTLDTASRFFFARNY